MTSATDLQGRRVAITGAGRGLGRALAIVAAQHGADLVLLGRDEVALSAVAGSIRARGAGEAQIVKCDLADPQSVADACRRTLAAAPTLDVLIHNGAPWLPGGIEETSDAEVIQAVSAAVTGTVLLTKGLLPGLRRSQAADIVTVVSTAGLPWQPGGRASAAFHAAKHGQSGFSERLREELRGHGIRVMAVYPPDFDDTDPLDAAWSEDREPRSGAHMTNREVASAVLFAITAPRVCQCSMIVLDNLAPR